MKEVEKQNAKLIGREMPAEITEADFRVAALKLMESIDGRLAVIEELNEMEARMTNKMLLGIGKIIREMIIKMSSIQISRKFLVEE